VLWDGSLHKVASLVSSKESKRYGNFSKSMKNYFFLLPPVLPAV
jgi:hypothetical protein